MRPSTHPFVNDPNDQATAGTSGHLVSVPQLTLGDLKPIATWTRIVVQAEFVVPDEILDVDLVVKGFTGHGGSDRFKFSLYPSTSTVYARNGAEDVYQAPTDRDPKAPKY